MANIKNLKDYGFATENNTYVIAEIGINHGGNLDNAKRLIDSAVRAGVDAVKFQTYLTEKRVPKEKTEIFKILKNCELPFEDFRILQEHAASMGVSFFSTPFDHESVEFLNSIGVDLYKIASFDVVNHALLREVAATGKPIVMSVGMASLDEIDKAYNVLQQGGASMTILHCISSYPLEEKDANLFAINRLQERYDCVIGYSDHTPDIFVPLVAVAAGAQVIEKHFKIDENMDCVDAPVSITEVQMREMVDSIRRIETIFGAGEIGIREPEKAILPFRRPSN